MVEFEKHNIDWIWDKCIDVDGIYDPYENFKELTQLLHERKKHRAKRRFIFSLVSISAAVFLLIIFAINDMNKSTLNQEVAHSELMIDKDNFIITIGERKLVNIFVNGQIFVEDKNIILRENDKEEIIPVSDKELIQLNIPNGKKYSVTLNDGSKILAMSNSLFSFYSSFSKYERKIKAIGHLFFEIEKSDLPFIVNVKESLSIIAYGTVFNMKNYFNSDCLELSLTEGKVSLKIGEDENYLTPNQTLQYNTLHNKIFIKTTNNRGSIFWKNQCFYFENVLLENLAMELSEWYGVPICFHSEKIKMYRFSGNIPDHLNLIETLDIINAVKKIYSNYSDGTIHFYDKKLD